MEGIKRKFINFKKKIKTKYRALLDNKKALDFIAAGLTIPVMVTLIISNYYNIQSRKKQGEGVEEKTEIPVEVRVNISPEEGEGEKRDEVSPKADLTPTNTPKPTKESCKLDPAPMRIVYPEEDEVVFDDPVCVVLEIDQEGYCDSEWAYRVNDAGWSDYSSSQICLFNMKEGEVKLEIKIKNKESERVKAYTRNFKYKSEEEENLTVTPTPKD